MQQRNPNSLAKFKQILELASQKGASDIHLKAGIVPVIRKHGVLRPLAKELAPLPPEEIHDMALSLMDGDQQKIFEEKKEIDMGFGLQGVGRFRINAFRQRGTTRIVIRNIPFQVPTLEDLMLPQMLHKIADYERGLVLVTGITGSGKSSTLAAMIDHINRTKNAHILTIEDPIEFLIRDRKSIITQRELGMDAINYSSALRAGLRQDPDVILIGEMRDRETIEIAMQAAETGHLVFSTLHTIDANESINRILGAYEPHQQQQVRYQIAGVLKAVISQRLARRKDGKGFVPAVEILINNARIREMIEDPERTKEIRGAIEEGRSSYGMQSFDQSLMDLIAKGLIDQDEAMTLSTNPDDFAVRMSGVTAMGEGNGDWQEHSHVKQQMAESWEKLKELEVDGEEGTDHLEDDDNDVA